MPLRIGIVGAGVVGAVAALGLARRGYLVELIEQSPPLAPPPADAGSAIDPTHWPLRHVALGVDSVALLAQLGVEQVAHGVFQEIAVWEELGTAEVRFSAGEAGLSMLGWMAELPALTYRLWDQVQRTRGVRCHAGASLLAIDEPKAGSALTLRLAGTTVADCTVDLLIGADGARSPVRALSGGQAQSEATGHFALATVVRTEQAHGAVARQRFLRGGPLALLPTQYPDGVSVVWSQAQADAERQAALADDAFCEALTLASGSVLGRVTACGQRAVFPIAQQLADSFLPAPRVALVGDAARVVHPLAGLGVNLGIDDVQALLALFGEGGEGGEHGERLPSNLALRRWARRRRARSVIVQRTLAALQVVYRQSSPGLSWARNRGVAGVNASRLLRQLFIHEALGSS